MIDPSSAYTRLALKHECDAETAFSQGLIKYFRGFGTGCTEFHAKVDADTLMDFAIHRR
jgi:hypothetical protein